MKKNGHKRIKSLKDLSQDGANANRHTEFGMSMMETSLTECGYGDSMTVDKNGKIISGNGRQEVLIDRQFADPIVIESDGTRPIIHQRTDLDLDRDPRAKRLALFQNRVGQVNLDWNPEILANLETEELKGMFTDKELAEILSQTGVEPKDAEPQIDKAQELQEKWGTATGHLWTIGSHRLLVGDATNKADVGRLCGNEKVSLVFTDPPYNVASENDIFAANVSRAMGALKIAEWDKNFNIRPALEQIEGALSPDVTVYVCSSHHLIPEVWKWMGTWATHHSWCAWVKPNPMPSLSKRHWTWNGELIAYGTRGKHAFNFPNSGHAPSMWEFTKHKDTEHPTEKTVELISHAISHSSNAGDVVLDPFVGSGTTLVAAENLNRKCYAMEISPAYVAVCLERMTTAFPHLKIQRVKQSRAA